ncbi:hypothetical protein [Streptomyces sp. ISL-63]|uniref:hypothetical protein n=1 Tax=unclassified Streptomyces TaxID=2593676 RepID=UPI0035ABC81B
MRRGARLRAAGVVVAELERPFIAFYESLGARTQDEWTVYRLAEGAPARLGAAGDRVGA